MEKCNNSTKMEKKQRNTRKKEKKDNVIFLLRIAVAENTQLGR